MFLLPVMPQKIGIFSPASHKLSNGSLKLEKEGKLDQLPATIIMTLTTDPY